MASIDEIIQQANRLNWHLITLCQYGPKNKQVFRATFQRRSGNGATESVFTEFEDAPTALAAVQNAFKRVMFMTEKFIEPNKVVMPPKLEKALAKAIDANWFARKTAGASRRAAGENDL